ncbi:hypothetical protein BDK51DRAFT_30118 [Blyttiomyces helicus]|uniref:Uncharacterized protein n=1 Tax=Blyttiomyces helicus TaxID=388810 RepID=A0A4P9WPB2_9FUNG|nr:hypothetical protein BDK51DRAFT_30118 [Blyttiomyces helicus]|eukprot:RKO94155.1 hypothetical protein BDK51DRAFT_30118 [Blyttiomyces helicus]
MVHLMGSAMPVTCKVTSYWAAEGICRSNAAETGQKAGNAIRLGTGEESSGTLLQDMELRSNRAKVDAAPELPATTNFVGTAQTIRAVVLKIRLIFTYEEMQSNDHQDMTAACCFLNGDRSQQRAGDRQLASLYHCLCTVSTLERVWRCPLMQAPREATTSVKGFLHHGSLHLPPGLAIIILSSTDLQTDIPLKSSHYKDEEAKGVKRRDAARRTRKKKTNVIQPWLQFFKAESARLSTKIFFDWELWIRKELDIQLCILELEKNFKGTQKALDAAASRSITIWEEYVGIYQAPPLSTLKFGRTLQIVSHDIPAPFAPPFLAFFQPPPFANEWELQGRDRTMKDANIPNSGASEEGLVE